MSITPQDTVIGCIGTGRMGTEVALLLINEGYEVVVNNRTKEKAGPVIANGAKWLDTPAEVAAQADVVITMLGFPEDVEDVYLGDDNIIDAAEPGTYLIDMTTSSPKLAHVISTMAAVNDLHFLDAPVVGDELAARRGSLIFMIGGEKDDYEAVLPILNCIGGKVTYIGEAGHGMLMKLATTIGYAGTLMGAVEALSFARATKLPVKSLLSAVRGGNVDSWIFSNLAPKMIADELDDGIHVKHFRKDLGLALQVAESYELTLPGLDVANSLMNLLATAGGEELATQALILIYSDEQTCFEHGLEWDAASDEDIEFDEDAPEGYTYQRRHRENR
jgi:3-hydroxyisobutyrate dehydrogenase